MQRLRVGVVRGGPSSEYAVSLKTGENVLRNLNADRYQPIDILLTEDNEWFMNGSPTDLSQISTHVDVIWNALHGAFGEDGKIQHLFERFGIPYTGSAALPSAVGMHKGLAKARFEEHGISTPRGQIVPDGASAKDAAFDIYRNMTFPLIVKPVSGGSSVATTIARTLPELERGIMVASRHGDVLVEEFIEGKEATVCVIDGTAGNEHIVLFPIEIVPPAQNTFFDFDAKYSGQSDEICPGRFPLTTHSELQALAIRAHKAIGARHYSRTDFIISPKGIFALELNTLPGLTQESLFPKALRAGGVNVADFLDHIIGLALGKR